ncbi:Permuted papain-like amidase enzyme, YaeF/YiiX, C92 family [Nitratireductor aquibiodomus]|uniref:Permuted papain-like amidase enzyme, YaeF/YiiX, C92 family n=1 Tax=Nitratireductor aquibiodomus TaxID=204799 RepID=A0A1H4MAC9_9HYPH|nr:YiiX/YebB-like N1pC/P60 family cysteine hydrolase [Nitratireductor aquibiodomus]SEB79312.1 Permuted papain-like amidase enzyme, YaeF/YiiX, C92 family [Nitratireductor aquibiodomus]
MKRIDFQNLRPGDIILTASRSKTGKAVRFSTRGSVSHAMIYVQQGSIIDSTSDGVQARNLQRELFEDDEDFFAFRLKEALPAQKIAQIVDFARSEIGTRYSKVEAARTVLGGPRSRSRREFCSRLVARAYQSAGVQLVADHDYCSPEDLRKSPLLTELPEITEIVDPDEIAWMEGRPNPIDMTRDAQNFVLNAARCLDANVENLQDVDQLVREHSEHDDAIAQAYRDSGYLDLWKHELQTNPWRYDLEEMRRMQSSSNREALREYCIATISEAYSGGVRFAVNLIYYQQGQETAPRETTKLLINLYETLVQNDQDRREVARAWLLEQYPDDVQQHMERVEPHSDLWFSIVDRVEPKLGMLARIAIKSKQSLEICSSCGDKPFGDYRIANSASAMPGVPSLRLCVDCHAIRLGFGERLELLN